MHLFKSIDWKPRLTVSEHRDRAGNVYKTAHYPISRSKIPFTFDEWCREVGFETSVDSKISADIYGFCSSRLTRPFCKQIVLEASTKMELDPGHPEIYEKMASFYILELLAGIPRREVWNKWPKIPVTDTLLQDEVFCLCVMALHPVLYGKLHPMCRNNRRVALEAIAGWDLPKFSLLQWVHPYAMREFNGKYISPMAIASNEQFGVQYPYWLFDDYSVVSRVIGKPGHRRWHELQFAGPSATKQILSERKKHGCSIEPLKQVLKKNKYIH